MTAYDALLQHKKMCIATERDWETYFEVFIFGNESN